MARKATQVASRPSAGSQTKTAPRKTKTVVKDVKPRGKSSPAEVGQAPSLEQISVRAYEIWLRKGRPLGQDQRNWLEAEAELKANA
jgi:Protein of unknown function (DUF2934)